MTERLMLCAQRCAARRWKSYTFAPIAVVAIWLAANGCGETVIVGPAASAAGAAQWLPADVRDREVPPEFFGLSLVTPWAPGTVWPAVPLGLYRLINATPRWHELHVGRNRWADDPVAGTGISRIDAVLLFRDRHSPGTPAMFTLGGGDHAVRGGFPPWLGRGDTIAEWRRYVRLLGERYRGRIRYWEVWNEPDHPLFYGGSGAQLVELTRVAAEELRAIDPTNVVIAPAFTDRGSTAMDAFLAAGGGRYVDVLAWHQDNAAVPEADTAKIRAVRRIIQRRGAGHLPLWTTEGHARLDPGGDPVAIVARTYLVLWAFGVRSFTWYAWDIDDYGSDDPGPWVTLVEPQRPHVPTKAGIAYGEVARWLQGARMHSLDIDGPLWTIALTLADGRPGWIVWRTDRTTARFASPAGVTSVRTLDGEVRAWSDDSYAPSRQPVLFF